MVDFIIVGVVLVVLFIAIRRIVNNRKKGSCCGCAGCEKANSCGAAK